MKRQLPSMTTLMGELSFDDGAAAADDDDDDAVEDSNDDDDGGMSMEYKDVWIVAEPTPHVWAVARAAAGG